MKTVKRRRNQGFTLLEIMVALTIFSVCAMVLVQQSTRSARQSSYLQTRTLTTWLAENKMHELRSELTWPEISKKNQQVELGNRTWEIITETTKTSHKSLRKVDVSVSEYIPGQNTQSFTLTSYMGEH